MISARPSPNRDVDAPILSAAETPALSSVQRRLWVPTPLFRPRDAVPVKRRTQKTGLTTRHWAGAVSPPRSTFARPGDHVTVITENIALLAEHLRACLRKGEARQVALNGEESRVA